MNISKESDLETWNRLFKAWVANHNPGKFYVDGIYYLALKNNDDLIFVQLGRPQHEQSSFGG